MPQNNVDVNYITNNIKYIDNNQMFSNNKFNIRVLVNIGQLC
jgi:hypothetical protein